VNESGSNFTTDSTTRVCKSAGAVPQKTCSNKAISRDDGDRAAKIIQNALGIESDDVANYCFPKSWPKDREHRARIIGEWLQTETRYLA
jgi:hypothetical protein